MLYLTDKKLKKEEKKREDIEDEVRAKKKEQGTVNRGLASLENKYQLLVRSNSFLCLCTNISYWYVATPFYVYVLIPAIGT